MQLAVADYDILIAGAGPSGAVAACLLARSGKKVGVIDNIDDKAHKIGESLPQDGAQLLQRLDLPFPQTNGPHTEISGTHSIWGNEDFYQDAFNTPGGGGWRLDRPKFDQELRWAAADAGATFINSFVNTVSKHGNLFQIETATHPPLSCHQLIDATGRRAKPARQLGATQHADSPLIATWAITQPQQNNNCSRTLIESDADGWWYAAVLPNGEQLAIFHSTPAIAAKLTKTPSLWRSKLGASKISKQLMTHHFEKSKLYRADARGLYLDMPAGPGWFACGDAALSFNPLASQGIYNAIATAATAATLITSADYPDSAQHNYRAHIEAIRETYLQQLAEFERRRLDKVH